MTQAEQFGMVIRLSGAAILIWCVVSWVLAPALREWLAECGTHERAAERRATREWWKRWRRR